jgi:transcriptional regulator with XRE-family HTH domain
MVSEVGRMQPRPLPVHLGPASTTPIVLRIAVGSQLRAWREAARIDRHAMSRHLGVSVVRARMIEQGLTPVEQAEAVALLDYYGIRARPREEFLAVLDTAGTGREWWHRDNAHLGTFDPHFAAVQAAELLRIYAPEALPPVLRIPDYARAVGRFHCVSDTVVERQIQLAHERHLALSKQPTERLWVVLSSGALRRPVAERGVMHRQWDHLLELAESPTVALQIITDDCASLPLTSGPFTILRFGTHDLPDVVHLPQFTGSLYLEDPDDVENYLRAWGSLAVGAQAPAHTPQLVAQARAHA